MRESSNRQAAMEQLMNARNKRVWRDLCEEAEAVEDWEKLRKLAEQITAILDVEQERLKKTWYRSKPRFVLRSYRRKVMT
jgi:hypothetical protein